MPSKVSESAVNWLIKRDNAVMSRCPGLLLLEPFFRGYPWLVMQDDSPSSKQIVKNTPQCGLLSNLE